MVHLRTLLPVLGLLAAACAPEVVPPPPPGAFPDGGEALAHVNGKPVPAAVVDAITHGISAEERAGFEGSPQYTEFMDGLVTQEALYQRAIAEGAHNEPRAAFLVALAAREAIVRTHLDKIAEAAVSDEAVAAEYEERAVQYRRPSVHGAHILVRDAALAADLKAQLDGGADFAALAAAHSMDPGSKDNGGDLGWFERERMLPEIAEPAFAAEPGAVLGPIESRVGFHLVKVLERRESKPLDEVRPEIEEALRQEALDAYVREVKDGAEILYPSDAEGAEGAGDAAPAAEGAAPAAGDHPDHPGHEDH